MGYWTDLDVAVGPSIHYASGDKVGNYTTSSASFEDIDTDLQLTIPAVAGDILEIDFVAHAFHSLATGSMRLTVLVSGVAIEFGNSELSFAAVNEELPVVLHAVYVVQSADISGGTITVKPQWRTPSATATMANEGTNDRSPTFTVKNWFNGSGTARYPTPLSGEIVLSYVERTTPLSVTATTEGTAQTIVTASDVTLDGSTKILIEFFSPNVKPQSTANAYIALHLYDGSSAIGWLGYTYTPASNNGSSPGRVARILTPSAGGHTYSIRAHVSSGTGTVSAGVGGSAADMPAFIRITRSGGGVATSADAIGLFSGTPDGAKYLRDDGTLVAPPTTATDTIWDAAGDLVQGTGANTAARLALGTAGKVLRVNSGATAVEWVTPSVIEYSQPTDGITRASTTLGALSTPWTDSVTVATGEDVKYDIQISFQIGSDATFYAALAVDGTIVDRVRATPGATNYETLATMSGIVTGLSAAAHTFEIYCGTHGAETVTLNTTVDTGTTLGTAGSLAADGVSSMCLQIVNTV